MEISALRGLLGERLQSFAWDQWAQMGLMAPSQRFDRWAADPEALLLLTLEVGRDEPRLLDEVLDWLDTNERLLSVQRLRNLARDDDDRALVEASLGWAAQWRTRPRLRARTVDATTEAVPFFRTVGAPIGTPDEGFLAAGFLKPQTGPSRKSQSPDLESPINFAFRMRSLLGIGARAEVARVLVCTRSPSVSVHEIAALSAFSKRNVQEALAGLRAAGVITSTPVSNEQRFEARIGRWGQFLGIEPTSMPALVDWPAIFHVLRVMLRWLHSPARDGLSEYMIGSESLSLLKKIEPDLRRAGVNFPNDQTIAATAFETLTEAVGELTEILS
jgi:hypothetical protein